MIWLRTEKLMVDIKNVDLLFKVSQTIGKKCSDYEIFTIASLKETDNEIVLKYEKEKGSFSEIVVVKGEYVLIKSTGDLEYELKLIEGKTTKSSFNFKDSFSLFSVDTKRVFYEFNRNGGQILLDHILRTLLLLTRI